ncbi:unnamed protein product [Penicillium salamii]|uniref:Uncharacterized protein n=1 Tax=Penicillium salamii TaxID=1612424 RepID=A0A9W4JIL7_9EURO|nr:unnamed protein product [Penicillium salamii]CAG8274209.1 unnamed protein product [Penicillium salamii]CAG8283287.1 unnamed protein product [Penicillium salamii]CAG8291139.1 unnamed protein product [Penicillium salamii]CAG8356228.1 unnamed protein product [Penicillium salamii]
MKVDIREVFETHSSETDMSTFIILYMLWEAWVLWTQLVYLEVIGITDGPSLLHQPAQVPALSHPR